MKRRSHHPEGRMTIVEHLAELRYRLMVSFMAMGVGAIVAFIFAPDVIHFLVRYYRNATHGRQHALIFIGPLDAFATRLRIATYGGIILSLPVWLWQLWRFITPGLRPTEKRYVIPFVVSSVALFAGGAVVALVTLRPALDFLLKVGGADLQPSLTADKYISLVSLMILAFGLAFEFPIVLMFLLLARVITTRQLRRWWRWAAVGIVAFAAVITPSQDPYSLFAMAIPMYVFYEACIFIGRMLKR